MLLALVEAKTDGAGEDATNEPKDLQRQRGQG